MFFISASNLVEYETAYLRLSRVVNSWQNMRQDLQRNEKNKLLSKKAGLSPTRKRDQGKNFKLRISFHNAQLIFFSI